MTYIPKSYGAQDVEPTSPRHSASARAVYADAPAARADEASSVPYVPTVPDVQKTMVYPRPRAYQQAAAYTQDAYQQQVYTQDAYQQEPYYEQPAMYPQEPRTQARMYQPQAAPRYDVPQTPRYAQPQPATSPQRLQRAAVPSPQRPQRTPVPAESAFNTVPSASPSELLSALPFPLRHVLALCCIALAWCLRVFSWAQVAVCVVSMIGFGPLRALVMYANLAVQSLVPQFLLGYAVIPTVFGGVLRGDLVFVAVLCACFDFLLQKLAYRLRQ